MATGKRSRVGMFLSTLSPDEKKICGCRTAIECLPSGTANALLRLLGLIFDQAFRRGWSFASRRLKFLAVRIVIRNKEVFNFTY